MDELAIISRARWSPSNNEIVGFCYNHKNSIQSWKFNNFLKVKLIEKQFANQQNARLFIIVIRTLIYKV